MQVLIMRQTGVEIYNAYERKIRNLTVGSFTCFSYNSQFESELTNYSWMAVPTVPVVLWTSCVVTKLPQGDDVLDGKQA